MVTIRAHGDSTVKKIALSFLAHPDDAEFLCGGTLMRLRDAGWDVHIATATAGDAGSMTENRWDISSTRTNEGRRAAELIGAAYHCLDERDIFVVFDKPTIQKTLDLFRRVGPTLVFTHAAKDYMMDHEVVSMLGRAATFAYGIPNVSNHPRPPHAQVPHLYYCDPVGGVDPYGKQVEPTTYVDVTAQTEKKAEMLACHASQRDWLREHHGMDEYLEAMRRYSATRGQQIGVKYAEAFVQHRGHSYPENDLLAELFRN
jgi:LmbE family N-acetylglucosaminyl deacetylase